MALLDDGGQHAPRADPVAPHHERMLDRLLVEVRGVERRGVDRAELEDVPDLDRRLEPQRAAATRTGVTLAREPDVGEPSVEVPPVLHAAQVVAGAVRAGDELPRPERLVEHDDAVEPDRARASRGPRRTPP